MWWRCTHAQSIHAELSVSVINNIILDNVKALCWPQALTYGAHLRCHPPLYVTKCMLRVVLSKCVFCPQLVKLCSGMIEAGKAYASANKLFVNGIRDLSQQCKKDEMISVRFRWAGNQSKSFHLASVWTIITFIVALLLLLVGEDCYSVSRDRDFPPLWVWLLTD